MKQRTYKFVLTSHVTTSVGWLGAVVVFLALAITGLSSQSVELARACFVAMEVSTWYVILPFCFTSLVTGIIQAVGTKWGLFKHYWIVVKLFLTVTSTLLLILHLKPIGDLSVTAMQPTFSNAEHSAQSIDMIKKSGAAALVLLLITTISIYKPWGRIQVKEAISKSWLLYGILGLIILIAFLIHLFGGGVHGH